MTELCVRSFKNDTFRFLLNKDGSEVAELQIKIELNQLRYNYEIIKLLKYKKHRF